MISEAIAIVFGTMLCGATIGASVVMFFFG